MRGPPRHAMPASASGRSARGAGRAATAVGEVGRGRLSHLVARQEGSAQRGPPREVTRSDSSKIGWAGLTFGLGAGKRLPSPLGYMYEAE